MNLCSGLYIVSTPIGNLSDITLRALDVLKSSDIILCEDTRVSNKLLAKHGIKASLKVYNDKSDGLLRNLISKFITDGKIISLISDAGTPLISDPGYKLVRQLKTEGFYIDVIPGPCAIIAALTLSGLPTDRFLFSGFLPKTKEGKKKVFQELIPLEATLIFYETANRLVQTLEAALEIFGDREANVARELTKLYQESRLAKLSELIEHYKNVPAKGEIVFSVSGKVEQLVSDSLIEKELSALLSKGKSAKTASDIVFGKYKEQFSRKNIYQMANRLK